MIILGGLILSYRVSTMKRSDFGDVLKIRNFCSDVKSLLLSTGVQIPAQIFGLPRLRHCATSRLSRQCGILNISQPYRPPKPVTGIALLFTFTSLATFGAH
jgi:hypothetical protein